MSSVMGQSSFGGGRIGPDSEIRGCAARHRDCEKWRAAAAVDPPSALECPSIALPLTYCSLFAPILPCVVGMGFSHLPAQPGSRMDGRLAKWWPEVTTINDAVRVMRVWPETDDPGSIQGASLQRPSRRDTRDGFQCRTRWPGVRRKSPSDFVNSC